MTPSNVVPQIEAEQLLSPYLAGIYEAIVNGAGDDYNENYNGKAKAAHTSTARATNRACHMFDRASLFAARYPNGELRTFDANQLRGLIVVDRFSLIFKKLRVDRLTKRLRSRALGTGQRQRYLRQEQIPEIANLCHLEAGYCEHPFTAAVAEVYIICPGSWKNHWELSLTKDDQKVVVAREFEQRELVEETGIQTRRKPGEVVPLKRREDA